MVGEVVWAPAQLYWGGAKNGEELTRSDWIGYRGVC